MCKCCVHWDYQTKPSLRPRKLQPCSTSPTAWPTAWAGFQTNPTIHKVVEAFLIIWIQATFEPFQRFQLPTLAGMLVSPKPRTESPVEPPLDRFLLERFRFFHAQSFGLRSSLQGYAGLVDEAQKGLKCQSLIEFQRRVYATLLGFFTPSALILCKVLSRVSPSFSIGLFVRTTPLVFRFLVGKTTTDSDNTLQITQCRFLKEAGPDACIKACKVPTEAFFRKEVGLKLELEPNHQIGSCRLCFSKISRKG